MPDLVALDDVAHWWGSDLEVGPTGDLGRASLTTRSNQRVLRRLMTNPAEYLWHPTYGAGVRTQVGAVLDIAGVTGLVRGQMLLEASVMKSPEPTVTAQQTADGVSINTRYVAAPERQPAALAFDVSE